MNGYKTAEEASKSIGRITADRLVELADSGHAPHYRIDGDGPFFRIQELRDWIKSNLVVAISGLPMPTRLSFVVPPSGLTAESAPTSISRLEGLTHIDIANMRCPGVYFLCMQDNVVYVGQSVNVPSRILSHFREKKGLFDPDRVFYLPVPESELLLVEGEFIKMLRPMYNGEVKRERARRAKRLAK